jgi:hypothetical protein
MLTHAAKRFSTSERAILAASSMFSHVLNATILSVIVFSPGFRFNWPNSQNRIINKGRA